MSESRLVATPELVFPSLAEILKANGWQIESQSTEPILAGEPEWAVFTHAGSASRIHYTFNPVVFLRVLEFRGGSTDAWKSTTSRLPFLDLARLRALLQSGDKRSTLLGLFAAGELKESAVLDLAVALSGHPDWRISSAAVRLRDLLVQDGVTLARSILNGKNPAGDAFALVPLAELRRQTLRWLARGERESNASIDHVLIAALSDSDEEVRITAVLAAAKLNARRVLPAVEAARIPESTADGAPEQHRLFYRELRRATVRYLSTGSSTEAFAKFLDGSLAVTDDPTLLLHALITPVDLAPKPESLPAGVEHSRDGYRLCETGMALCWVPAIDHWLGGDHCGIRAARPEGGLFIAEHPLEEPCTYDQAIQQCESLARRAGIFLGLPTPDQWEMAARGPDGRRYPWGNSVVSPGIDAPSPWGVRAMVGAAWEWTRDVDHEPVVCGGESVQPCSLRTNRAGVKFARLRPVVEPLGVPYK